MGERDRVGRCKGRGENTKGHTAILNLKLVGTNNGRGRVNETHKGGVGISPVVLKYWDHSLNL